jgi:predicted nucleic acid-binding Zn ribbon protein
MIYNYKCPHCNYEVNIDKPMAESGREEYCEICEGVLERVYVSPVIFTADGMKK